MIDKKSYVNLVVECLIRFVGVERETSVRLLKQSRIFNNASEDLPDEVLHEEPYFWAMELFYGRSDPNNYWFNRPELWPPPTAYHTWLKEQFTSQ